MWTSVNPAGGASVGGFPCATPSALACDLPVGPDAVSDDEVGAVELALVSTGAELGGVDEATTVSVVDVAAGAVAATEVDEAAAVVDVASTCARTGLTTANPITSVTTTAKAPTNVMMLVFIICC